MLDDTTAPDPRPASMRRRVDFDTEPELITAPVTAEGLRERLIEVVTRWALMYPLGNWGIWGTAAGASRDQLAEIAEDIAAGWGRDIADRVLAALAGDPGDLPARIADAIVAADAEWTTSREVEWKDHLAAAAMSVRWEHAAAQSAEVERLRAELTEVKAERDTNFSLVGRLSTGGFACATQLELMTAERDALKAAIETGKVARFAVDVHRLIGEYSHEEQGAIALTPFEATLDQLCLEKYGFDLDKVAALAAPETTPDAPTAIHHADDCWISTYRDGECDCREHAPTEETDD